MVNAGFDSLPPTDSGGALDYADKIYRQYEANRGEPRTYLGASVIGYGLVCKRQLWYRLNRPEQIEGRVLRLFDHGNSEEDRLIRDLRHSGIEVTGEQLAFKLGALRGHLDGLLVDDERGLCTLEVKTHNKKSYDALVGAFAGGQLGIHKQALSKWQIHRAQMHVAMGALRIRWGVYAMVCKDNDALHFEAVEFDREFFDQVRAIVDEYETWGDEPPARAVQMPDKFGICQWCPGYDECWNGTLEFNW